MTWLDRLLRRVPTARDPRFERITCDQCGGRQRYFVSDRGASGRFIVCPKCWGKGYLLVKRNL